MWWKLPGGEWWGSDERTGIEPFLSPMSVSNETFAKATSGRGDMAAGLAAQARMQIKNEPPLDPLADLRDAITRSLYAAECRAEIERLEQRPVPGFPHRSNDELREALARELPAHPSGITITSTSGRRPRLLGAVAARRPRGSE